MARIAVPDGLADNYARYGGEAGTAWIARLPRLADALLDRWELRPDGAPAHGVAALVLPVRCPDGTPAALKLQQVTDESVGEPEALRRWAGDGAVRLLAHDPESGTMLLERLDADRSLGPRHVPDDLAALGVLAELLARLVAVPAPPGVRTLADITDRLLARVDPTLPGLRDPRDRRRLRDWASAVREVRGEPGDRLLHWDLHYENVLAAPDGSGRGPWLAIDPKPLAGDPGFDLLPALHNRWPEVRATGDVPAAVRRRFDLLTEVVDLDRERAVRWTLARLLQDTVWAVERGESAPRPEHLTIADALTGSRTVR